MDDEHMQVAQSRTNPGRERAPVPENRLPVWKRRPSIVAGTLVLAILLFFGLRYLTESFTHESTDDAFLHATVISAAPKVAGQVKRVYVDDNQLVRAGNLLVEIDPRDLEVQLAQKKAAQAAAEANVKLLLATIEMFVTQVATAEAATKQSEAETASDQAMADRSDADLKRAEELMPKKIISAQEYDAARAAAASARAKWQASQEKAASQRSKISETRAQLDAGRRAWERARAQAAQAAVDVQQAELNSSYTRIVAPQDARVTRKAVEAGDYVQVGQQLMALVVDDIDVFANFKETQLKRIRPGQAVKVAVDSVGGRRFAARVDSVQAGTGAAFSLLPPENAVGNYVKVVQRVPVKIVFDRPLEAGHVLGPGMSVVPSIRVTGFEIPDFVVAVAAALLALITGFMWWRVANQKAPTS